MKLTLEQLAPYLPYVLMINDGDGNERALLPKDMAVRKMVDGIIDYSDHIRPILRPLSDLGKEEFKKQLSFGMIYDENTWFEGFEDGRLTIGSTTINACVNRNVYYQDFLVLFENHFDVFGLIDANLAIDINTINN